MKLDKIKFARLIGMVTSLAGRTLDSDEIEAFDYVCDVVVPESKYVSEANVNELLMQIANPDGFIPAIRAYRTLTGAGLKDAKEAVEKYRFIPATKKEPATLGDILNKATERPPVNFDKFEG